MELSAAILLSTYNGELYLDDKLESIYSQPYTGFIIYIRDDGSTDNTIEIIKSHKRKRSNKIVFFHNENENIGIKNSIFFSRKC